MEDDEMERLVAQVEALHAPDGSVVVLSCPHRLSDDIAARLRHAFQEHLPGRKVLVLTDGMTLRRLDEHRMLQALDRKLDAVAAALSTVMRLLSDDDAPAESRTLDGDRFPSGERDQTQPL